MPHKIPEDIAQVIKEKIPSGYKMWWIRGIVLSAGLVNHKSADDPRDWIDTKVVVGDVDAPGEGYDVILEGKGFEFAEGDLVTLLGHEPVEASTVSSARFLFHHNTGTYTRAYRETGVSPRRWDNLADYKNRLGCQVAISPKKKISKLIIPVTVGLFLSVITGLILALFIIIPFAVMFLICISIVNKFSNLHPKWTSGTAAVKKPGLLTKFQTYFVTHYVDITGLYEDVAHRLQSWVYDHPDKEKGFVVVERGRGTQGKLVE